MVQVPFVGDGYQLYDDSRCGGGLASPGVDLAGEDGFDAGVGDGSFEQVDHVVGGAVFVGYSRGGGLVLAVHGGSDSWMGCTVPV